MLSDIDGKFDICLASNSIINSCVSRIVPVTRDCGYAFLFQLGGSPPGCACPDLALVNTQQHTYLGRKQW